MASIKIRGLTKTLDSRKYSKIIPAEFVVLLVVFSLRALGAVDLVLSDRQNISRLSKGQSQSLVTTQVVPRADRNSAWTLALEANILSIFYIGLGK